MYPYNPNMKSCNLRNVELFARKCENWDEFTSNEFELPTGERVKEVIKKKIFGADHYIHYTRNKHVCLWYTVN